MKFLKKILIILIICSGFTNVPAVAYDCSVGPPPPGETCDSDFVGPPEYEDSGDFVGPPENTSDDDFVGPPEYEDSEDFMGPPAPGGNSGGAPLPGAGTGTTTGTGPANSSSPIILRNPLGIENVTDLVNKIGGVLVGLAIPIAVIMIIWSGVQFLIAGGNAEMIGKAKKTLWWSIIGLAVIFIGKGFITLIQDILSLKDG